MATLRRKMVVLVGGLVASLAGVSLLLGTILILWQALDLETRVVRQNMMRVARMLEREVEHVDRFVCDWAFWDDTYEFIQTAQPKYEAANLIPKSFSDARINFMIFYNRNGEIVRALAHEESEDNLKPVSEELLSFLQTNHLLKGFETSDNYRRGVLMIGDRFYLVSARAILTSDHTGPSRGTLMMGRLLDERSWQMKSGDLLLDLVPHSAQDSGPAAEYARRLSASHEDPAIGVSRPSWRTVSGYLLLRDLMQRPAVVVEARIPRRMFLATLRNVGLFGTMIAVVCGVAIWSAVRGLNRIVLARTAELHQFVNKLHSRDTLSERAKIGGEDEIGMLAEAVNLLLDKLQSTVNNLRQAESTLQEQKTFLRQVIDAYPGYVWVKDEQHRFLLVNRGLADFCQTTPGQMIGKLDSDFHPSREEIERFHREDDEVRRAGQLMVVPEERVAAPNGSQAWISTYKIPLPDAEGRCTRVLAVAVDITELKRGQEALRQSEVRYRRLYENAPVAILLWDKEGRVLGWNPRAESLFGWKRHEVLWRNWIELLVCGSDREPMTEAQRAVMSGHAPVMLVASSLAKSGARLICEWHHAVIHDEKEGFVAGLSFAIDVTDRKRVEEEKRQLEVQVQQAQKLESLGVLAGGIAHDFNNILMAILGNADLALSELPPDSPARTTVEEIILGSRRAADLCRQLLAYSGHGRFVIEPLNLNRVVQEMTRMLEVAICKKAVLRIECADHLPSIEADGTQIRQVLMNLIMNASEAIGQRNGMISVRTGLKDCSREFLNCTLLGNRLEPGFYVYLEVTDTGCGMDRETVARIFEPFFTTKFTGRGLGLAAVLGIVRSHDGAIEVHSELGKGTTFRVYFPVSEKAWEQMPGENGFVQWHGSGTILVVDDEETVRMLAARMLERCGFKVLMAQDGREAMSILKEHVREVTAILLDLTMPHMDGYEVLTHIRQLNSTLPVVLSSGYSEQDLSARFNGFARVAFLEKPYTRAGLIAAFRKVLHV